MRALVLERPATNTMPVVKEVPTPTPGPREVLVRIHAAALNHRDLYTMNGRMQPPKPFTMGADGAGVIAAVGSEVRGWQPGDRVVLNPGLFCGECEECLAGRQNQCADFAVLGFPAEGTAAEYAVVPARNLARLPEHLDFKQGAALPMALSTAWNVVVTVGRVKRGETVLIHGIGGGVALFALQLAAAMGARVIVTSGSDEKLERAQALGAFAGINYKREDVLARVKELTGGRGADLVVDAVGAATLAVSFQAAAPAGRVVWVGSVTGQTEISTRLLGRTHYMGGMATPWEFTEAIRFVDQTLLEPVISEVYPLSEAETALRRLAEHAQFGKVILTID